MITIVLWNKSFRVAAVVVNTTSKFLADSKNLIVAPLLSFVLVTLLTCLFMAGFWSVSSIDEVIPVDVALQKKEIVWEAREKMIFLSMLVVYIWIITVCLSINEFVITFSTINWYYASTLGEINALRKD